MLKAITSFIILFAFSISVYSQNFPKLGNDTLLDVANWNIEWFGDASNGPTDEATQYANVKAMLEKTDMDVFGLEEISNASTYNTLSIALGSKYDTYISGFSQTQKMGIYWKKSMFTLIPAQTFDIPLNSSDNFAFASRPPLQVCLQTLGGTKTDTVYFLILHMKAYADQSSYDRRVSASVALKSYLESTLAGKKYMVLGDWNDDLDQSIYNSLETPFKNFLNAKYTFPSKELTDAGKSSYAFSVNMIDHQLISKTLDSFYYKGSAKVFDDAANYCSGFSNNTSDHYPVYASYNWKKLTTRVIPAGIKNEVNAIRVQVYPNPANSVVQVNCDRVITASKIFDNLGRIIPIDLNFSMNNQQVQFDINTMEEGVYFLHTYCDDQVLITRLLKQ
jgi:endonuclease/exonuclease/phosphatase family metal-dependent hydrolase